MTKIKPITNPSLVNPLIASKINEIIGVVNDLALSDKEEECNCCGWDDNRYTHEPGCNLREKPKQEECEHKWQSSTKLTQSCEKCAFVKTKQSTSLKEYVLRIVLDNYGEPVQTTDKVLELIQSHLVKEIETLEPDKYMKMHDKRLDGYTFAKQDIITIINNISK